MVEFRLLLGVGEELRGVVRWEGWGWGCEFDDMEGNERERKRERERGELKLTRVSFPFVSSTSGVFFICRDEGYQYPDDGAGFDFGADDGGQPMEGVEEAMKPIEEGKEASLVVSIVSLALLSISLSSFLPSPPHPSSSSSSLIFSSRPRSEAFFDD